MWRLQNNEIIIGCWSVAVVCSGLVDNVHTYIYRESGFASDRLLRFCIFLVICALYFSWCNGRLKKHAAIYYKFITFAFIHIRHLYTTSVPILWEYNYVVVTLDSLFILKVSDWFSIMLICQSEAERCCFFNN